MTAYLFIFDFLTSGSAKIDFIGKSEIDYINNMDMEKHRKSIQ
jgi:serine kinase of HPr protein (carbohydrate metabolism regulator)